MTKFCAIKMVTCIRILMEIKLLPFSGVCLKLPKKKKRKTHNRIFCGLYKGFQMYIYFKWCKILCQNGVRKVANQNKTLLVNNQTGKSIG